jgi:5-methylcytosine-specific restriction enzyme A
METATPWRERVALQLADRPMCAWCLAQGRISVAVAVAYAGEALQSLCAGCFEHKTNPPAELGYAIDIGLDGYPLDSRHPFNRPRPR